MTCGHFATEHYTLGSEFINGYKFSQNKIFNFFNVDKYIWNLKKNNYGNIDKIICTSEWMHEKVNKSRLSRIRKLNNSFTNRSKILETCQ